MESHILKVGGKHFRCSCGCNVFHDVGVKGLYICNACSSQYANEDYEELSCIDAIDSMPEEEFCSYFEGLSKSKQVDALKRYVAKNKY